MPDQKPKLEYEPKKERRKPVWVPILTGAVLPIILGSSSALLASYAAAHGKMMLLALSFVLAILAGISVVIAVIWFIN